MSTTVPLSENRQDLHHPVTGVILGEIISRVYEGENVQRHHFEPRGSDKTYKLGPTTTEFKFFDWPALVQPILDQGFGIKKLDLSRGGLKAHIIFSDPKRTYADPIGWDKATWGKSKQLEDSVVFKGGIRPGSGFHYHRGFFRMICTNGLVVETLNMGQGDYNHQNFKPESLADALFAKALKPTDGPVIGSTEGLSKAVKLIGQERPENMPFFLKEFVSPLEDLTGEFASNAVTQFEMLINSKKEVHEIDIANGLTSALNLMKAPADRLPHQVLNIQRSLTKLTGIYSL